jgi:hypothetical protein
MPVSSTNENQFIHDLVQFCALDHLACGISNVSQVAMAWGVGFGRVAKYPESVRSRWFGVSGMWEKPCCM